MKKLMGIALLLVSATGCVVAVDDGPPRVHTHCYGCGHVYVRGSWHNR